jgi:hypothetical protein
VRKKIKTDLTHIQTPNTPNDFFSHSHIVLLVIINTVHLDIISTVHLGIISTVHLGIIKVLLPTDAQKNWFKRSFKIYIKRASTYFSVITIIRERTV